MDPGSLIPAVIQQGKHHLNSPETYMVHNTYIQMSHTTPTYTKMCQSPSTYT
uniref:Uncharacterized protein n=1 Tax=Anguilla anguilla TaxID=7936 RepID=A0A0E9T4P2_ANGAN